jgi:hypothetical protein
MSSKSLSGARAFTLRQVIRAHRTAAPAALATSPAATTRALVRLILAVIRSRLCFRIFQRHANEWSRSNSLPRVGISRTASCWTPWPTVPRHEFVPETLRKFAYWDEPLPIGYGQTISQPFIVAFMTEQLNPKPTDRDQEAASRGQTLIGWLRA